MSKEPKAATMLAARLARAYPSLSAYSAATLAEELCAIERAQRRHAERCCSGEDGGYVKSRPASGQWRGGTTWEHDRHAEARAGKRIRTRCDKWENRVVALHDRKRQATACVECERTLPAGTTVPPVQVAQ